MTTLNDQERALQVAAERLADAAQALLDDKPESVTALKKAIHTYRVGQVMVDKAIAEELESQSKRHDMLLARAHSKIFGI